MAWRRTLRLPLGLSLLLGMVLAASVTLADATDTTESLGRVAGSLRLHQLPGGTFTVDAGVLRYRNYPAAGTLWRVVGWRQPRPSQAAGAAATQASDG